MMANDKQRLEIVLRMEDPFDHEEFMSLCQIEGIEPLGLLEYGQKVGMVMVAQKAFPELSPGEAYMKLIQTQAIVHSPSHVKQSIHPHVAPVPVPPCGSCGGGIVR